MIKDSSPKAKTKRMSIHDTVKRLNTVRNNNDTKKLDQIMARLNEETNANVKLMRDIDQKAYHSTYEGGQRNAGEKGSSVRKNRKKSSKKKPRNKSIDEGEIDSPPFRLKTMPIFNNKFAESLRSTESSTSSNRPTKVVKNKRNSEEAGSYNFEGENDKKVYEELQMKMSQDRPRRNSNYMKDHKRTALPALKPKSTINIFKILKDAIGKDLSRF